ncbi:MAG: hypothetical protein ACR2IE_01450 [Candidatus Sumerlaeaceae bacterium]
MFFENYAGRTPRPTAKGLLRPIRVASVSLRLAEKAAHRARKPEIHGPGELLREDDRFSSGEITHFFKFDLSASLSSFYTPNLKKT